MFYFSPYLCAIDTLRFYSTIFHERGALAETIFKRTSDNTMRLSFQTSISFILFFLCSTMGYAVAPTTASGNFNFGVVVTTHKSTANLTVYPNPASNQLFIKNKNNNKTTYSLWSASGQCVRTSTQNSINVSTLPEGIYYLSDQAKSKKTPIKVVIQRYPPYFANNKFVAGDLGFLLRIPYLAKVLAPFKATESKLIPCEL